MRWSGQAGYVHFYIFLSIKKYLFCGKRTEGIGPLLLERGTTKPSYPKQQKIFKRWNSNYLFGIMYSVVRPIMGVTTVKKFIRRVDDERIYSSQFVLRRRWSRYGV